MTFGQIKCFLTVANEQSFAKAAGILYISQPAVSKSVAKLEEELGFPLIDRHGAELSLTPAGRRLYDFFIKVESNYQELIENIRQFTSTSTQTVRIGCPDTWDPGRFYDRLMEHFRTSDPPIELEIEGMQIADLFSRLQTDRLDLILTYESQRPLQYGFTVQQVAETGCGLLYSKAHYGELQSLSELKGADILTYNTQQIEKKFSRAIKRACNSYGIDPEIKSFSSLVPATFSMSCGKGALLLTDWESIAGSPRYGFLPLPNYVPINLVFMNAADKPYRKRVANEIAALLHSERMRKGAFPKPQDPFFS